MKNLHFTMQNRGVVDSSHPLFLVKLTLMDATLQGYKS